MRILILGGSGMLGHQVIKGCIQRGLEWWTIVRSTELLTGYFGDTVLPKTRMVSDIKNVQEIRGIVQNLKPDYIINCIGVVKQSPLAKDHLESIAINALLPHQLEEICSAAGAKLVHISTDCVFDGEEGNYKESDKCNAVDLYGQSKHLGEVDYGTGLTIRTSIIGHEITESTHGLIGWFLAQQKAVKGFTKAIFSGLTTVELTNVILDVILPSDIPAGLYQVASTPISKFDLLKLTAEVYNKQIDITPSDELKIDRSLNGEKFASLTGYQCPDWYTLLKQMKEDFDRTTNINPNR